MARTRPCPDEPKIFDRRSRSIAPTCKIPGAGRPTTEATATARLAGRTQATGRSPQGQKVQVRLLPGARHRSAKSQRGRSTTVGGSDLLARVVLSKTWPGSAGPCLVLVLDSIEQARLPHRKHRRAALRGRPLRPQHDGPSAMLAEGPFVVSTRPRDHQPIDPGRRPAHRAGLRGRGAAHFVRRCDGQR
jgi:hypothetical protein